MKNPTPPSGTGTLNAARTTGRYNAARDLKRTRRDLVKSGCAWATQECLAARWDVEPQRFAQFEVDGHPAVACGDVEALGARFAIPFYERCIARLRASESASARDLRDLSEQATEQCAALQAGVRKAWADRKYSLDELDGIEADALAGVAGLSAVLAEIARMRNALRAQEQGE